MSFYGTSFSFDGVSCEEFGLMLYDVDGTSQGNSKYAKQQISEDFLPQRNTSLFYGTCYKTGLEFTLVFGADEYAAAQGEPIDRQEMEAISSWLTDHNEYKWLVIDQPDMEKIRYSCIITDLEVLDLAGNKWAFSCNVHCNSPYGYLLPKTYEYEIDGETEIVLTSRSSANCFYYPNIIFELEDTTSFSIINESDGGREFSITNMPQGNETVTINGDKGILTSTSGLNLYQHCNFMFPRLKRGDNTMTVTGRGTLRFICEFPVMIGG